MLTVPLGRGGVTVYNRLLTTFDGYGRRIKRPAPVLSPTLSLRALGVKEGIRGIEKRWRDCGRAARRNPKPIIDTPVIVTYYVCWQLDLFFITLTAEK